LFDGRTLVLVQFRALSAEDIQREDCVVDICVVPREFQGEPNQCTAQYALYKLACAGWQRLSTTLGFREDRSGTLTRARVHLSLDGFTRKYEYWSGKPIWFDNYNRQYLIHPHGYQRVFVYRRGARREAQGFWTWIVGDQQIDDTLDCFISRY
jgi:hypothetical protein